MDMTRPHTPIDSWNELHRLQPGDPCGRSIRLKAGKSGRGSDEKRDEAEVPDVTRYGETLLKGPCASEPHRIRGRERAPVADDNGGFECPHPVNVLMLVLERPCSGSGLPHVTCGKRKSTDFVQDSVLFAVVHRVDLQGSPADAIGSGKSSGKTCGWPMMARRTERRRIRRLSQ
jgi:hypothetical protein